MYKTYELQIFCKNNVILLLKNYSLYFIHFSETWYSSVLKKMETSRFHVLLLALYATIGSSYLAWFDLTWLYLTFPTMDIFPNVVLPLYLQSSWIVYLIIGAFYSRLVLMMCSTFLFTMAVALIHEFYLIPKIMTDLCGETAELKISELFHVENLCPTYRAFELLYKLHMENYAYLLPPIQALLGQYGLIHNYNLILNWEDLSVSVKLFLLGQSVIVQAAWITFLTFGGWFYARSGKVLKSWKHLSGVRWSDRERKLMGKFIKSCKPMYVGYPGLMKIRKISVPRYFQGLFRGTCRMLLTLRGNKVKVKGWKWGLNFGTSFRYLWM